MEKIVSSKQYTVSRKKNIRCKVDISYCLLPTAYCLLFIAYCLLFTTCSSLHQKEASGIEDMKRVYQKEVQYRKARVSNDLNKLYSFQHPEYKAIIALDKFKSSDGYLQLDYSSVTEKNPMPQAYMPIQMFPATVKDFKIEKCFIDRNGRYVKFHTVVIMDMFFLITGSQPMEREFKDIDYWEKFNGEWFILNKVRPEPVAHISGAATAIPINLPEEKAEYIEVDIKQLQ